MLIFAPDTSTASKASMKVPPKRKGNLPGTPRSDAGKFSLNESPSEKEGKCGFFPYVARVCRASMKVPPKRKGNTASPVQAPTR